MNGNKLSKNLKRKTMTNFKKSPKLIPFASDSKSSCSIFKVDEDVQFVVNNDDASGFHTSVPLDKNIELSRRTYSKKNPITYPGIPPTNQEPFKFSIIPEVNTTIPKILKKAPNVNFLKRRNSDRRFISPIPEKVEKANVAIRYKSASSLPRNSKEFIQSAKSVENAMSSDSDIEVIEVKVFNPNALNSKSVNNLMGKPLPSSVSSSSKRKFKDVEDSLKKKNEADLMLQRVSKPCFMANDELVVNEADTAPYMPNNPSVFPAVRCASGSVKWPVANGIPRFGDHSLVKKRTSSPRNIENQTLCLPNVKFASDKGKSRELKSLYDNLNEISWTQEKSFKNLLRNPEYIRHSERKALRKVKQIALKNSNMQAEKKFRNGKLALKKCRLAKANSNKKVPKVSSSSKISKSNVTKSVKCNANKLAKPNVGKMTKTDDKSKIEKFSEMNSKANLSEKNKVATVSGKMAKLKSAKKQSSTANAKVKTKVDSVKLKSDEKVNPVFDFKEKAQIVPKPKVEISEASSSGMQNGFSSDMSFYNTVQYSKDRNFEKFIREESLDSKRFDMIHECKKQNRMYSAVRKGTQCRVRIEPLEHTNLWNTEYYEEFRKHYLHQALRKAMEKREPNCITAMLQELCDSYMMPVPDDSKVSKKKKPEEEILRSSARQIEGAFRYKEIVVKKLQNYMQVILVPNDIKKNCLSIDAIKELRDAFLLAKKDPKCRAVLLNSSGSYFCTGIDLSQLVGPNKKQACEEMASVIRELVLVLGSFTKPVVAAVNGAAVGFGVSLLTYCDVVLASDKATFCIPSTTIGYMPEGGLTLTLPQIVGNVRCSEMLLQGKKLTASQAYMKGLVSEVLWPTKLMNEVIPRVQSIIAQPLQVMEATKLLVRSNVWDKLKSHMDFERRLLVNQWLSTPCQDNIKRVLRGDTLLD